MNTLYQMHKQLILLFYLCSQRKFRHKKRLVINSGWQVFVHTYYDSARLNWIRMFCCTYFYRKCAYFSIENFFQKSLYLFFCISFFLQVFLEVSRMSSVGLSVTRDRVGQVECWWLRRKWTSNLCKDWFEWFVHR